MMADKKVETLRELVAMMRTAKAVEEDIKSNEDNKIVREKTSSLQELLTNLQEKEAISDDTYENIDYLVEKLFRELESEGLVLVAKKEETADIVANIIHEIEYDVTLDIVQYMGD